MSVPIAFIVVATLAGVAQRAAGCPSPPLAGYYFASSYASAGRVAWLFALDPKSGKGAAFTPRGETVALRDASATDRGGSGVGLVKLGYDGLPYAAGLFSCATD